MPEAWSQEEVEATVADYFEMLAAELSGRPYSKAEHRRRLIRLLRDRSEQSIEFKHANISAILIELGFPYISGYKPRSNYQSLLYDVVRERLEGTAELQHIAEADADRDSSVPSIEDVLATLTDPPKRQHRQNISRELPQIPYESGRSIQRINYLEREARNQRLGLAGEEFVVRFEQARLIKAGKERLAVQVEHTSRTQGDGVGYDVLSFEENSAERLIEVKTTKYGVYTPFFVTQNELATSAQRAESFHLYRVYDFRETCRLFTLKGTISHNCHLEPRSYIANVG